MKKVLLLLSFLVAFFVSNAQYPVTQFLGSDSAMVKSRGGLQGRFAPIPFTDTAAANLSRIRQYPGALIYTSGVDKYWYRNATVTGWVEFTSSGGSTVNIYNSNGNISEDRYVDGGEHRLQFNSLQSFQVAADSITFNLVENYLFLTGLVSTQDTTTYKPIVVDPITGRVMQSSYWYGGTGGSGGSGIVSLGTSAYGLTIQNDSTYKADTIQLSTRLWRQKGIDSVQGNVTSGLALKLNLSDTASMLTNYVRRQELKDTAAAIRSAIGGGGSGSVTSVGSGYGLSGGPITTTGTLSVDSATLSNHYLRRKDSLTASNLLGYVTRQVLADSMAGIATSYILNEITTGYDSLSYVEADTLKLKGLRVVAGTNATVTPTITGTTISYSISGNDTTSLSNRINLKLSIADTANMLLNYVRRQELKDTAAAIRSAIGGGGGSPVGNYGNIQINRNGAFATPASDSLNYSGGLAIKGTLSATAIPTGGVAADSLLMVTSAGVIKKRNSSDYVTGSSLVTGRFALVNGTGSITSSSKFNYSDATYPTMSMIGSDPLFYIGPSATLLNNPAFGHASGAVIYGGATYKGVQLVDQVSGGIQMARFYNSGGTIYNNLNGLIISNTLSSPSNYQGSYTIQRTVPYSAGLNYHGFTDQTVFNSASTAFNSFGSFATIGNDRSTQNHYAAFQSVWYKDSSNTVLDVYDFVSAVSEMREGTIDTLFRFKVFELTKSGGTINVQYGIHIPDLNTATTNYGAYIENNVGIGIATPTEKLHVNGNIKTGDPGSGAGSWKLGTAVTTSGLTLNTTTYVEVSIGGTVYRLAVVDPPQP